MTLSQLIQEIGDICHQKYMGCTKSRNTGNTNYDWDYSYTDEVVNMLDTPEIKELIIKYAAEQYKKEE